VTARGALPRDEIIALDRRHVWHPYTAADVWERTEPLVIARAQGARLFDADGASYLDGNASWWTASLGHAHPRVVRALSAQAETLGHCALAGITHEPAARLASELAAIAPGDLQRVFYTDNGSTAVECAVKMAIQAHAQRGEPGRDRFIALDGAFHGDTVGAASLGGVEVFRRPFAGVLFDCVRAPSPADGGHARAFEAIERLVREGADTLAAVVVEPIVQGAAGMQIYSPEYLRRLRALTRDAGALLVVDEVFTGFGRTGPMWACEHADTAPDLMCVGKTLAYPIPMGAVLTTEAIYDAFRGPKDHALMYGHTFCGNPIGAAVAREVLAVYRDERVLEGVAQKAPVIARAFASLVDEPHVTATRSLGMIGALDLAPEAGGASGYLGARGWRVFDEARRRGAYLRPLGDTVYVCPPLTIGDDDLEALLAVMCESVRAVA
jgi:adenosylmethionine---8-amino-7-oxononanoate aminotransferase